jgi:hypothetical protein
LTRRQRTDQKRGRRRGGRDAELSPQALLERTTAMADDMNTSPELEAEGDKETPGAAWIDGVLTCACGSTEFIGVQNPANPAQMTQNGNGTLVFRNAGLDVVCGQCYADIDLEIAPEFHWESAHFSPARSVGGRTPAGARPDRR